MWSLGCCDLFFLCKAPATEDCKYFTQVWMQSSQIWRHFFPQMKVNPCFNEIRSSKGEVCTLSVIRIFTIIYDALQHYYDKWFSPESWSSLLMSPLAKKQQRSMYTQTKYTKNTINAHFKRHETLQMFSGVFSCSNTKTRSWTQIYNPKAALSAASWNKQTAVSTLHRHPNLQKAISERCLYTPTPAD